MMKRLMIAALIAMLPTVAHADDQAQRAVPVGQPASVHGHAGLQDHPLLPVPVQ